MFEGNEEMVGVAGRTLTDVCGEREGLENGAEEWIEFEVDEVEEALEWLGTWWTLRIEEMEDEVDLRPRRPPDECRYDERGVIGAGEREARCLGVGIRGRG